MMAWAAALLFIEGVLGKAGEIGLELGKVVIDLAKSFLYIVGGAVMWLLGFFGRNFKDPRVVAACSVFFLFFTIALIMLLGTASELVIGPGGVASGAGASGAGAGYSGGPGYYYAGVSSEGTPGPGGGGSTPEPEPSAGPGLCGSGSCDSFKTSMRSLDMGSLPFASCSDSVMYYDIPYYCVNSGVSLNSFTWRQWAGDVVFRSAECGLLRLQAVLNDKCVLANGSLYYVENSGSCPQDCPEDDCLEDRSCDQDPNNCGLFFCCPSGTLWAGRCLQDYTTNDLAACNFPDLNLPDLAASKHMPVNCPCSSSSECVGDFGGSTCCPAGTYHDGFCYKSQDC